VLQQLEIKHLSTVSTNSPLLRQAVYRRIALSLVPYSIKFKKDVVAVQVNSQMGKTFLSQDEVFNRIPLLS
jgi:hypothetical protein